MHLVPESIGRMICIQFVSDAYQVLQMHCVNDVMNSSVHVVSAWFSREPYPYLFFIISPNISASVKWRTTNHLYKPIKEHIYPYHTHTPPWTSYHFNHYQSHHVNHHQQVHIQDIFINSDTHYSYGIQHL